MMQANQKFCGSMVEAAIAAVCESVFRGEIYEDDTFAGDDDAEDSPVKYEDMYADGYDAKDEAMAVAEDILATGFDEEEDDGMDAGMVFAEDVMDGGMDGEDDDLDLLEIDELDAEEDDYSEL